MASNTFQSEYYNSASAVAPTPSGNSGSYQYLESKQLPAIFVPPGSATQQQPGQANQNLLSSSSQSSSSIPLGASSAPGNYNSQYSSSYVPSNDYSYGYYYNGNSSDSTSGAPSAASGTSAANSNTQRILPLGYSALAATKTGSYTSSNTPPQIYPQSSNFPSSLAYHQYHPNYITTSSASGATQSLPPPGVASYHQQHQQTRQSISSSSTQSPSQKSAFPVSPQSIGLDSNNDNDSYSSSSYHNSHNSPIDYSSLVSYTISPTLKRKRNKAKSLSDASGTNSMDSKSKGATFSCQVCHKVFQKQYNLKSHMKIHFSEKPFQCSKCPKRFARSHDKKRHELLHEGVKNFKCEGYLKDGVTKWGCGKKFVRSDALSRHFRTETGWLCIRPLMEESKRLENKNMNHENHPPSTSQFPQVHLPNIHQQQLDSGIGHESQDHGLGQINSESDAAGEVGIAGTNPDGSYIYNSSLIRGMIQSK